MWTTPHPSPEEIGRYYESDAYISHSDTNKGLFNRAYHTVRQLALKQKYDYVRTFTSGQYLLDIGCGTGYFLSHFVEQGNTGMGVEPDQVARQAAADRSRSVVHETLEGVGGTFDLATMWHVLEHDHQPAVTLRRIHNILCEDGLLFIAVPNHHSYDAVYYQRYWAAYDVPRHLHHFSRNSLNRLAHESGFERVGQKGMVFDSFYVSMLSQQYIGNGGMIHGALRGLISNLKAGRSGEYSSLIHVFRKR
ncbi:MAG: class I SAM-dependent methyltransferase [Catalinimonas sp.]